MKTIEELEEFCLNNIDDGYGKHFVHWCEKDKQDWLCSAYSEYTSSGFVKFRRKYVRLKCEDTFK